MKINLKETAVLVIDVQNDYWKPPRTPRGVFLDTLQQLLSYTRARGARIIYIQHANEKPEARSFREGTAGFEIHAAVRPQSGDLIVKKHTPGSFYQTNLEALLKANSIKTLIITGMQTQKCCDTTTREASARNYSVYVISDAVETFDLVGIEQEVIDRDEVAKVVFAALQNGFAEVLPFVQLKALLDT